MDERFTFAVYCFTEEQWIEPDRNWPPYWFDRNSYSRWAAYEIIDLLRNRGDEKASTTVKQFKDKMDNYSCYNPISRNLFRLATEAADDILDIVRAMEE